jgi:hypothetical protein
VKVADIKRDVIAGVRPGKGIILSVLAACEQAGVDEIDEIPIGLVRLIYERRITTEDALEAMGSGEKWCSWHQRFEPIESFAEHARRVHTSRDCTDAHRERYQRFGRPGR